MRQKVQQTNNKAWLVEPSLANG